MRQVCSLHILKEFLLIFEGKHFQASENRSAAIDFFAGRVIHNIKLLPTIRQLNAASIIGSLNSWEFFITSIDIDTSIYIHGYKYNQCRHIVYLLHSSGRKFCAPTKTLATIDININACSLHKMKENFIRRMSISRNSRAVRYGIICFSQHFVCRGRNQENWLYIPPDAPTHSLMFVPCRIC